MKTIVFTVTNDLNYDQRMQRICRTIVGNGYDVILVGRLLPHSTPLQTQPYKQVRLTCRFNKGVLFYAEYNLRLFKYLLSVKTDAICSIDLDTILSGCWASILRRKKRVLDAHEYFTEVPELVDKPIVKAFWEFVARVCMPFYKYGYTVSPGLAAIFKHKYKIDFKVVRNVPLISNIANNKVKGQDDVKILIYQGALNEGRGIEAAIMAMHGLPGYHLWLIGEGDLSEQLRNMVLENALSDRIKFWGMVTPEALKELTPNAWLTLNLLENKGLSYYYSLANKFFDSIQAEIPVLTMGFPEYTALNTEYEVAILITIPDPKLIQDAIRNLSESPEKYQLLKDNCRIAREKWNWNHESKILLDIWKSVLA